MSQYPTYNQQIFSDEELSEIFQIDFAEIFGSPDKPSNKYGPKKTVLPSKGTSEITICSVLTDSGLCCVNPNLKSEPHPPLTVLCK